MFKGSCQCHTFSWWWWWWRWGGDGGSCFSRVACHILWWLIFARLVSVHSRVKSSPLSLDTKPSRWQVQQSPLAAVLRPAASPPTPQSTVHTPFAKVEPSLKRSLYFHLTMCAGSSNDPLSLQVPKSWPQLLPRSPTVSLVGCLTSPQVSLHQSACPQRRPAHLLHMDWSALQGKCHQPAQGKPHLGLHTHFPPHRPWLEHSPSHGPLRSPGRDPVCPLPSHLQHLQDSLPRPRVFSPWSRASWTDCLLGIACLQVNTHPWQQHHLQYRWRCSAPLSDLLWHCPMGTVDECRTL